MSQASTNSIFINNDMMTSEDIEDIEADNLENEIDGADDDNIDGGGQENMFRKKLRKKTSEVWQEMKEVLVGGVVKVQCTHCKGYFAKGRSGSTTQHRRHLEACLQRKVNVSKGKKEIQQQLSVSEDTASVTSFSYDHAKVRELAAHMTLAHEYPFSQMEHEIFNKFLKAISPFYQRISRFTVRKDCFDVYAKEKTILKSCLLGIGRISITTDLWKSGQHIQYMVVTGHYVDRDWTLQKRVLNFCNVPPPHTGVIIADALHKCFVDWGIEDNISSITVDNASYNDVCVRRLKADLSLRKPLSIGGKLFHVRCCAHILNLLVQDGLKQIETVIDTVREGIKYLKNSESRLIQFAKIKNQLKLSCKSLSLDCQTRWNGTYMMLASAIEVKDVFSRYADIDHGFHYVPSSSEWIKVQQICEFLGLFNVVTNIISGSEYPTSNLFLVELFEIKTLLNEKALDECDNIRNMSSCMAQKFDKYWGESNVLLSLGALLDPRYKMSVINLSYEVIYGAHASNYVDEIMKISHELFKEYEVAYNSSNVGKEKGEGKRGREIGSSSFDGGVNEAFGHKFRSGSARFFNLMCETDNSSTQKSELDIYLAEHRYTCDVDAHLDVLDWWKGQKSRFPILSKMASDILSIPITSVASESTFSAGGRVVDEKRASLAVETVEMLLCGRDWVRASHGLKKKARNQEEDELSKAFERIALPDVV